MRRSLPIMALVLLAPSAPARAASFPIGTGQGPGVPRYLLNRARTRGAVRLRPRSGRARTLRLRLHRRG